MDGRVQRNGKRKGGRGEAARDLGGRGPGRRTLQRPLRWHVTQNLKVNGCYS